MDKNKNRADLLRGREKLRQFQQKKDKKSGKSSKKASKDEQQSADPDAVSSTSVHTSLSVEMESKAVSYDESNLVVAESGSSQFLENKVSAFCDASSVDSTSTSIENETNVAKIESTSNTESLPEHKLDILPRETAQAVGLNDVSLSSGTLKIELSEEEKEIELSNKGLSSISTMSVMQTREDQEDDSIGSNTSHRGHVVENSADSKNQPCSHVEGGSSGDDLAGTNIQKKSQYMSLPDNEFQGDISISNDFSASSDTRNVMDQQMGTVTDLSSPEAEKTAARVEQSAETLTNTVPTSASSFSHQEDAVDVFQPKTSKQTIYVEKLREYNENEELQKGKEDSGIADTHSQHTIANNSLIEEKIQAEPQESPLIDPALGCANPNLPGLCSLVGERNHPLVKLRDAVPDTSEACTLSEKITEELIVANCMKDLFGLQLAEKLEQELVFDDQQCELTNKISLLHSNMHDITEKNQWLTGELARCQFQFQDVSRSREELENQIHLKTAEIEMISSRELELHQKFLSSQKHMMDLEAQLADCKDFAKSLKVENETLKEKLVSVVNERTKFLEERDFHLEEKRQISTELADCKTFLEELQVDNTNLRELLASTAEQRKKLEEEIKHLSNEVERLSLGWAESKDQVAGLELENADLSRSHSLLENQKNELEEDKKYVLLEHNRISSEVVALEEQLTKEKTERLRYEVELKELKLHLEQGPEENVSMNICKARMVDDENREEQTVYYRNLVNHSQIPNEQSKTSEIAAEHAVVRQSEEVGMGKTAKLFLEQEDALIDSPGFISLKRSLEEAEKIVQNLEIAIDSHSAYFVGQSGKTASTAVSKLIQAFESKGHHDEDLEERDLHETTQLPDPFSLTKHQTCKLKELLEQSCIDLHNANILFKGEQQDKRNAIVMYGQLKDEYEALQEHSYNSEGYSIELAIQYEALKHYIIDIIEKKNDLEDLCQLLKQADINFQAENQKLSEKVRGYQVKVCDLHSQVSDLQRMPIDLASLVSVQMENLQKEMIELVSSIEQGWSRDITQIVGIIRKWNEASTDFPASTVSTGTWDGVDLNNHASATVNDAVVMIEGLQKKYEATLSDHEVTCRSYKQVNQQCDELLGKNELAFSVLHRTYDELKNLAIAFCGLPVENLNSQSGRELDLLNYDVYETLIKQLASLLNYNKDLESVNDDLKSQLIHRTKEVEELKNKCLDFNIVGKLTEDVEYVLGVNLTTIDSTEAPLPRLKSLLSVLIQKYREANAEICLNQKNYGTKFIEMDNLQELISQLETSLLECENESLILKETLSQSNEALTALRTKLLEKKHEVEQSEQRALSIREKLSIAVAKGKGLVVQRDSLKQSLADTSNELQRCLEELQSKDTRLQEVENKLKTYSEAGEHVEALETELSYIRNSATALRESFLLKDSVLQRIEEILEDLDLPEHFHSRDIIEKIDWLANSAASQSLPVNDWDQKSSLEGGSFSDTGLAVMDAWKDDGQMKSNAVDDFRTQCEELQSKFYGLAEQNEMLEQSLMERNNLVHRWEAILDTIAMPQHLKSMEAEDRLEWLVTALSDAKNEMDSFQQKIDNFENYCRVLTADLEASSRRVSVLDERLTEVTYEKEYLSQRTETLCLELEKLSVITVLVNFENENLNDEVRLLQQTLVHKHGIEEKLFGIESKVKRLHDLVSDALQESQTGDPVSESASFDFLESLVRKLIDNYAALTSIKSLPNDADGECHKEDMRSDVARSADIIDSGFVEQEIALLRKDLEETLNELMQVKSERDECLEKQSSLNCEIDVLCKRQQELQELLNQEEQKSASVRDKLNIAVRKGKLLVQQRDGLKQNIEEMNNEIRHLKDGIEKRDTALAEHAHKLTDVSTHLERLEALESESLLLKNHLAETEKTLRERDHTLSMILNIMGEIEVNGEDNTSDPLKKLEGIRKAWSDMLLSVVSFEQDLRKSRRAAELLVSELNEVQERNDSLQEEVAKASAELDHLRNERDLAAAAKVEALSKLEKLSAVNLEERKKQATELKGLESDMNQLQKDFTDMKKLLSDVFSKYTEVLQNLDAGLRSCIQLSNTENLVDTSLARGHSGFSTLSHDNKKRSLSLDAWSDFSPLDWFGSKPVTGSLGCQLQQFSAEIGAVKEKILKNSNSLQERSDGLFKLVMTIQNEITSEKCSGEVLKREISEKQREVAALNKNVACLYESCTSVLVELENRKVDLRGTNIQSGNIGSTIKSASVGDGDLSVGEQSRFSSDEHVKFLADRLLLAVKDFADMKTDAAEVNLKEMKIVIANLQRELQEKDVEKDKICMELVQQIKEAEAAVKSHSRDLQSSRIRVHELEKQVESIEAERKLVQLRVNELEHGQVALAGLEAKLRSQTDLLASKDQEIDSLMQALDEEESQMEDLRKKTEELEKVLRLKNVEMENLEASRGKVTKKLAITVNKFDELHHLSESLLTEVEKLQSQLHDRDAEISFLRQEVTRCTNDVLVASQMANGKCKDEVFELLKWLDKLISRDLESDMHPVDTSHYELQDYKEKLQNKMNNIFSEMDDLRVVAQRKDGLLLVERSKVEELTHREETLRKSLHEKELQLNLLEAVEDSETRASEISELEPAMTMWTAPGTSSSPQVRSLRKGNSDHVAIAVDSDPGSTNTVEEDDDKVHGFKSLTSSVIVPKITRPVTDLIDGLWVSCDRTLMRKPALRLGIMMYWAVLHALLATFIF